MFTHTSDPTRSQDAPAQAARASRVFRPLIQVPLRLLLASHGASQINTGDSIAGFGAFQKTLKDPEIPRHEMPFSDPVADAPPQTRREPRRLDDRAMLLQKVYEFWVNGVLEPEKTSGVWLDLLAEPYPEPAQAETTHEHPAPDSGALSLGSGSQIADVFDRMGRELLILGGPGSGKTMTLLELARDLILRAQADSSLPIPVVLNLASWARKRALFAEWLVERLNLDYQVPRVRARRWIESGRLLLLLDGLDEVLPDYRSACAAAINEFWATYPHRASGMVVCCRFLDYQDLAEPLCLENAVMLKALTPAQVDWYLEQSGESWTHLRAALSQSPVLQQVIESPLMLTIMAAAYRSEPVQRITEFASAEDQRQHLFECYVSHCLADPQRPARYSHPRTRHYLAWLAQEMAVNGQTAFQVQDLQPSRPDIVQQQERVLTTVLPSLAMAASLLVGLGTGLLAGTRSGLRDGLGFGLLGACFFAMNVLFAAALSYKQSHSKIRLVGEWRWSAANAAQGVLGGVFFGLVFAMADVYGGELAACGGCGIVDGIVGRIFDRMAAHILLELASALLGGLLGGLGYGLRGSVIRLQAISNPSSQTASTHARLIGLGNGLLLGSGVAVVSSMIGGPMIGLLFGLPAGMISASSYSGAAILQHAIPRYILWRAGVAPLRYTGFLSYVASRHLLRKVGGSYLFRHRMLLDYFARLET